MSDFAGRVLASAFCAAVLWAVGYLLISFVQWEWADGWQPLSRLFFAIAFVLCLFASGESA